MEDQVTLCPLINHAEVDLDYTKSDNLFQLSTP